VLLVAVRLFALLSLHLQWIVDAIIVSGQPLLVSNE
jgi:hypothetical protein